MPVSLYSKNSNLKNKVVIFDETGKPKGSITIEQFIELVKASDYVHQILLAEKEKRLHIIVPKKHIIYNQFTDKIKIRIVWKTKKKKIIKELILLQTLEIREPSSDGFFNIIHSYYRDIAELGFPIMIIIVFIVFL